MKKRLIAWLITICMISCGLMTVYAEEETQKAGDRVTVTFYTDPVEFRDDDGGYYSNPSISVLAGNSFMTDDSAGREYEAIVNEITADGHTLMGWYGADGSFVTADDFYRVVFTENTYYEALLDSTEYHTVTFKTTNGYFNDDETITEISVQVPVRQTLGSVMKYAPYPNFTSGYTFDFWKISTSDIEYNSILGTNSLMNMVPKVDMTVTPSRKSGGGADYTIVQYHLNGGHFADDTEEPYMKEYRYDGYGVWLDPPAVEREGYTFTGWSSSPDGNSDCYTNPVIDFSRSSINHVYAEWESNAPSETCGENLTWSLDQEGVLTISGTGDMYDYADDDFGNVRPVPWIDYYDVIKEIRIEEGVTGIGAAAFNPDMKETALETVIIADSVQRIGQSAFAWCYQLKNIEIPEGIRAININTFYGCANLKNITIPQSVTYIGRGAFARCDMLENVIITNGDAQIELTDVYDNAFTGSENVTIFSKAGSDVEQYADSQGIRFVALVEGVTLDPSELELVCDESVKLTAAVFPESAGNKNVIWSVSDEEVLSVGEDGIVTALKPGTAVVTVTTEEGGFSAECSVSVQELTVVASGKCGADGNNLTWSLDSRGLLTISGTGEMKEYYAAEYVPWYEYRGLIRRISLPEGLTKICGYAFADCIRLTEITVPDGVSIINEYAFFGCTALETLTLPCSVSLGLAAGKDCSSLTTLHLTAGSGSMHDNSIERLLSTGRNTLTTLILDNGITKIEAYAFRNCSKLKTVSLPEDLETIGHHAFLSCSSLREITLPDGMTSIENDAFSQCGLTEITIPASVTSIESFTFSNCSILNHIVLSKDLHTISEGAFHNCADIIVDFYGTADDWKSIVIEDDNDAILNATIIYHGAVSGVSMDKEELSLAIGASAVVNATVLPEDAYNKAVIWTSSDESVAVVDQAGIITGVSEGNAVITVTTEEGGYSAECRVTVTNPSAMSGICGENLTWVLDENGVLTISGTGAMHDYTWFYYEDPNPFWNAVIPVKSIVIEDGVTHLGNYAFQECLSLTSVSIPDSVVSIGGDVFEGCRSLTELTFPDSVQSMGRGVCYLCESLKEITIPEKVNVIKELAFGGCCSLEKITILNGDTIIETSESEGETFGGCDLLTIYSVAGSSVEEYAIEHNIPFVALEDPGICGGNHTPAEPISENETAATCTEEGSYDEVVYCSVCHEELSRERITIEKLPHTPEEIPAVAATCTETGRTAGSKCSVCGEILTAQEIVPALGHDYIGEVTRAATCSEEGIRTFTCKNDPSHTYTEPIAKLDHTPAASVHENETAATCTEEGSYDEVVYCLVCHEELSREKRTVEKLPHTPEEIPAVAATCTETGRTAGSKCSVCGEILTAQEIVPALGHDYVGEVTKDATCSEEGIRTFICKNDPSHTYTEVIAKLDHTPAASVHENETAATCTEEGSYDEVVYCSVCHEELSREKKIITKRRHSAEVIPEVPATCTKIGYTEGSRCLVCGEILIDPQPVPALGHSWDDGKVTKKATYTQEGVRTYTCTRDASHSYTEAIPKLDPIDISKAAVSLSTTTYTYSGAAKKPTVTVKYDSVKLIEGSDYTIIYSNNKNAGTAKVTITGIGKYTGKITKSFTIKQKKLASSDITLGTTSYVYNGKVKKPTVTVESGTKTLVKDTDYTVKYTNNKDVGKATVTITGKGNYTGAIEKTFKIVPKATTIKSATPGSKKFTVKWTKQATQTTGYQIQYSLKKDFASGNKTVLVSSNKTVSKVIEGLTSGKTYYVRIRTYKTVSGTKYYSAWSEPKSVKVK